MCGRFSLNVDPTELKKMIPDLIVDEETLARFNIAPTQEVAAALNESERRLIFAHWGLIPFWAKDASIGNRMINARGETIHEKPAFRNAFKKRRCLIFADGFYEWKKEPGKKTKIPMYFCLKSGKPFAFAGLWENWRNPDTDRNIVSCTIITTTPNIIVEPVHNRMPVILPSDKYDFWLEPGEQPLDALRECIAPYPAEDMKAYPVSTRVNNPQNDDSSLLMPLFED